MEQPNTCKRGCCWSNFGVCGRRRECPCHTSPAALARQAAQEDRDHAIARGDRYRTTGNTHRLLARPADPRPTE